MTLAVILNSCSSPHPYHPSPRQPLIYFVSMNLPVLDTAYKCNHKNMDFFFFFLLVSLTQHNDFKVYPC